MKTTLANIDKFYAQKAADFINELKAVPEGTGTCSTTRSFCT